MNLDADKEEKLRSYLMKIGQPQKMADGGAVEAPDGFDEDPESKIESSHPGVQPDQLDSYLKNQGTQVDKFGPDQQQAVNDSILKEQQSPITQIGRGMTGFADAIMQGVARAGPSNFQKQYDENLLNKQKMQAEAVPQLQKMNLANMGEKQKLETQTSTSPLGKSYVDSFKPIAQKLFPQMDDAAWSKISRNPSALEKMFGQAIDIKKAEAEIAMKEAMLGVQKSNIQQTHQEHTNQQQIERDKARIDALKETAKHTFLHPFEAKKAQDEIAKMGQGGSNSFAPDVLSYAQKHNITPEQAQAIKDKRTGGR